MVAAGVVEEGSAQAEVLIEDEVGLGVGVDSAGEDEGAIELPMGCVLICYKAFTRV